MFKSSSQADRICHAIHELIVGLAVVNRLRIELPTFVRTEGFTLTDWLHCQSKCRLETVRLIDDLLGVATATDTDRTVPNQAMSHPTSHTNSTPSIPVLLLEPALPSMSLRDWFESDNYQADMMAQFYLHLIGSLMLAHGQYGFIHQDLSPSNILLQPLDKLPGLGECRLVRYIGNRRPRSEPYGPVRPINWIVHYPYDSIVHQRDMIVPLTYWVPRIIDYGLSSIEMNGRELSYVSVVHSKSEVTHFFSDISKLIGFPIWYDYEGTERQGQEQSPSQRSSHDKSKLIVALARETHARLQHLYQQYLISQQEQALESSTFRRYVDYMKAQWLYRLYYPRYHGMVLLPKRQHLAEREGMHPFVDDLLYALALFEYCVKWTNQQQQQQQDRIDQDTAPYLPRQINAFRLVNFFYLPNFEMVMQMEEIYLKAQLDPVGQDLIPPLKAWVHHLQRTRLFEVMETMFCQPNGIALSGHSSSSLSGPIGHSKPPISYQDSVRTHVQTLHQIMPSVQTYVEQVMLSPGMGGVFASQLCGTQCCVHIRCRCAQCSGHACDPSGGLPVLGSCSPSVRHDEDRSMWRALCLGTAPGPSRSAPEKQT